MDLLLSPKTINRNGIRKKTDKILSALSKKPPTLFIKNPVSLSGLKEFKKEINKSLKESAITIDFSKNFKL